MSFGVILLVLIVALNGSPTTARNDRRYNSKRKTLLQCNRERL